MEIFTIGFTRTTAEDFFERLKSNRIERLLDVRLNNKSQLAGFAKRDTQDSTTSRRRRTLGGRRG